MPAFSAKRRRAKFRRGGKWSPNNNALNIKEQQEQGVHLDPGSKNKEGEKVFDAARAAMHLLKEEDRVWTIKTFMETINVLRARNNSMKAQLLEMDTNFKDHVQARQRRVDELEKTTAILKQAKESVEVTLEMERGERRAQERVLIKQREMETQALESTIQNLTVEVESLQAFSGARDRARADIAALKAENQALRDNQEMSLQSLRQELARERASRETEVERALLAARENLRQQVTLKCYTD